MSILFPKKQLMSMKTSARSSKLNWIDMSTAKAENLRAYLLGVLKTEIAYTFQT